MAAEVIDLKSAYDAGTISREWTGRPVWIVYGEKAFPRLICAKINIPPTDGRLCVWGYSVWRRQPGFRTLGTRLETWAAEHGVCEMYANQDDALDRLRSMTTPRCS